MRTACFFFCLLISFSSFCQYKNDNVLYKTVDPRDLCKALSGAPGYLLLDVRSPGEYGDSSQSPGLNLGRLSGSVNIDIRQLGQRLSEIAAYKDKPVFIYCSHSQRSRRASKLLADSGFIRVNNINGGLTAVHLLDEKQRSCLQQMLTSANSYSLITPAEMCRKMNQKNQAVILDVRPDSAWQHISLNPKWNAYGHFKDAIHIPVAQLKENLVKLKKDKEIIVTDINGGDAAIAARLLFENGYSRVSTLVEGIDRWLAVDRSGLSCFKNVYVSPVTYQLINSFDFARLHSSGTRYHILDVRSAEEFSNLHKDSWRNNGHIKNAVNIPTSDFTARLSEWEHLKEQTIVVYAFSNMPEVYAAADTLAKNGFKDVRVLTGGLFNLRWTAANVSGMKNLHELVVDVPAENQ